MSSKKKKQRRQQKRTASTHASKRADLLKWAAAGIGLILAIALATAVTYLAFLDLQSKQALFIAKKSYSQGNYKSAWDRLTKRRILQSEVGEQQMYMGLIADQQGREDVALPLFRKAAAVMETPYLALLQYGQLAFKYIRTDPSREGIESVFEHGLTSLARGLRMTPIKKEDPSGGLRVVILADFHQLAAKILNDQEEKPTLVADHMAAAWKYYLMGDYLNDVDPQASLNAGVFYLNAGFPVLAVAEFQDLYTLEPDASGIESAVERAVNQTAYPEIHREIFDRLKELGKN